MPTQAPSDLGAALIGLIGTRGPLSRADAARLLNVSPTRITRITKALLATGLITETGTVPSDGGRPATMLALRIDRRHALGVKVTPNHLTYSRVDLAGQTSPATSINLNTAAPDAPERIVRALAEAVGDTPSDLLGIGLALPGSLDGDGLVNSPVLGWQRVALPAMLNQQTGLPAIVDNDVNALAIAAQLYEDSLPGDIALVTIGIGIGCAFTMGSQIYRGAHGGAGELGHTVVDPDGEPCVCGLHGCLETLISDDALTRRARAAGILAAAAGKDALNAAAVAGDAAAVELFGWAGAQLGYALGSLAHLLDPALIIISGEGADMWQYWEPGFTPALRQHIPRHRRDLRVVTRDWGEDTWAVGAAALVFASPFEAAAQTASRQQVRDLLQVSR